MLCSCGHTVCECEAVCLCCPFMCLCEQCFQIRSRLGAHCGPCGGWITPYVCSMIPEWRRTGGYPNRPDADFLRAHERQPRNRASDEQASTEGRAPEDAHSSPTTSRRSSPETSESPPRETFDDELIFQMDDIDPPSEAPTNTCTGARSRDFRGSSHSNSSSSGSNSEQCEPPRRARRNCNHSPNADILKLAESPKCKMPICTPLQKHDNDANGLKLRESQSETPITTQDVAGCANDSLGASISEIGESQITGESRLRTLPPTDSNLTELLGRVQTTSQDITGGLHPDPNTTASKLEESETIDGSSEHKIDESNLIRTEQHERELITKDIPGCSHQNISKQEESQITDGASYAVSPPADEYASDSLLSNLNSDDSPLSAVLVPLRSTCQLSTSAPAICDLPQSTCELKPSEQTTSTAIGTSETSATSKFEALKISDSHLIDESRTSPESSSTEIIPENMPNGDKCGAFHGQPDIPLTVAPSQLNSAMQVDSSESETSQTLSTSNSLMLQSPEVPKSAKHKTSSESDSSVETVSKEKANDTSEDEAPTNESPKKNN